MNNYPYPHRKHSKINLIQIAKGIGINGPERNRGWVVNSTAIPKTLSR